jgi:tRNA-dependent cyclodipeptide synthase
LLIEYAKHNFNDFALCLTDGISRFTLEALGYSAKAAQQKTKNNDNNTHNKIKRAFSPSIA